MNIKTTVNWLLGIAIAFNLFSCTTDPTATPKSETLNPDTEKALVFALATYLGDNDTILDASLPYKSKLIDLNNDNRQDALVLLVSPNWCGSGGCTLLVFENQGGNEFQFVSKSTLIQTPFTVSEEITNEWRDLIVPVSGGGAEPMTVALKFDGEAYPLNPSTQDPFPSANFPPGQEVFSDSNPPRPFGDTAERQALCRQAIAQKFDIPETALKLTLARTDEGLAIYDWQTANQGGYCQVNLNDNRLGEVEVTR